MAQRNAVYERTCTGCDKKFRCTAKELAQRIQTCKGSLGSIFLPDCGLAPNVMEAISGTRGTSGITIVS